MKTLHKDNLLRPVSLLFIITAIVALINFGYNIVMSRMLTLSDFGDLRALFSIVMILAVPAGALQTMISKFTAEYHDASLNKLRALTKQLLILIIFASGIFIALFSYFRYWLSEFLQVSSPYLVVLLGPAMLVTLLRPLILGLFQGLQRFALVGFSDLVAAILKLVLGIGLVWWGFASFGAIYGFIFAGIFSSLIFGGIAISLLRQKPQIKATFCKQDIVSYSGYALGVLICFSIISQVDILIVKHKFLPSQAGLYACAAVIGKAFLFLPIPIVTVLFPKVIENNKQGRSSLAILNQSLFICLLLCIIGAATCLFMPRYLLQIFGAKYSDALQLVKIFPLAMSPFALFYVLMNYFLCEYRLRFFYYCLLVCILATAVLALVPQTLSQFILVLGCCGLLILMIPLLYIYLKEGRPAKSV